MILRLKKTALVLSAIACFSIVVHMSHADRVHASARTHDCGLCQSLSSSAAPAPAPTAPIYFFFTMLALGAVLFRANRSYQSAYSRGPPAR